MWGSFCQLSIFKEKFSHFIEKLSWALCVDMIQTSIQISVAVPFLYNYKSLLQAFLDVTQNAIHPHVMWELLVSVYQAF